MSSILWEPAVPKKARFWRRQFALVPTGAQDTFDAVFGVISPVLSFMADPLVFKGGILGPPELENYQIFGYLVSTVAMGMFLVWRSFRKQVNWLSPLFAGVFFAGAVFSIAIGLVMLPLTLLGLIFVIGIFGFIPFLTAFVYLRAGVRALRTPLADMAVGTKISAAVFGAVLTISLPAFGSMQFERVVSRDVEILVYGDPQHAEAAAQRLERLRVLPSKYRAEFAYAYGKELDPVRQELLKRTYQDITGENLEIRQLILSD